MTHWKFAKAIDENEEFKINQMNIWNFQWHCLEKKWKLSVLTKVRFIILSIMKLQTEHVKLNL
jgi:hypothetical protein